MKNIIGLTAIILLSFFSVAAQTGNRHWVEFTDKNGSSFTLNNPSQFLSARAISRRNRQNIPIDSTDLPVNQRYIDSLVSRGLVIRNRSRWLNGVTVEATPSQLASIQSLPFVKGTTPAGKVVVPAHKRKPETRQFPVGRISYTPAEYGDSYNQIALHKGHTLHNAGFRGEGMLIAVFDAGFINVNTLACFDSLRLQNKIKDTWDFVDLDNTVYEFDSHGTYVLGCMAGWLPGQLIGTAPKADYLLYRTENNVNGSEYIIEEDNWVAGAERADSAGADVFNTSLSYTTFDDPTMNHTYADLDGNTARITRGADMAAKKGVLVVVSAGNYGTSSWQYIGAPADGDSVLSVGAIDAAGNRVSFSSIGPSADGRIKPNVVAQGSAAISCALSNGITQVSGTSFSGPIMAGLVACLWQTNPTVTNMQLLTAIQNSGSKANAPDNLIGYGIPDMSIARLALSNTQINMDDIRISVYPNPVEESFEIQFNTTNSSNIFVSITDANGRKMLSEEFLITNTGLQVLPFQLSENFSSGIYFVNIIQGNSIRSAKLVKK
jgi:subtilisin family serine protease